MCILNTPPGYQRMGGAAQLGPLPCSDCQNSVRNQFQGNPQATCTAAPTPSSQATGASSDLAAYAVQTAVTSFWDGFRRGRQLAQQRAAMEAQRAQSEEQQRQVRIRAAREGVRQREIELAAATENNRRQREAEFQQAREELDRELQRPPGQQAAPAPGLIRGGGTAGGTGATGLLRTTGTALPGAHRRLYCSAGIARLAAEALLAGRTQEATFLVQQSQNAYTGARMDVECPAESTTVPSIGGTRCTVRENGADIEVPCDEEPLRGFYPELLEVTGDEIERLASIRERFPNLPVAKTDASTAVRERSLEFDRIRAEERRTPPPSTAPPPRIRDRSVTLDAATPDTSRDKVCTSERCQQARQALVEARRLEAEVDASIRAEREATTALRRNATILRGIETNPASVSSMISRARSGGARQ